MASSSLKPIKLYGGMGPNPPKIRFLLGELGLEYDLTEIPHSDVKSDWYTKINPNGRLPSIIDPNYKDGELTLWESGAIIEYLIDTYDKENKFSFAKDTPEYWHAKKWLYFQVTGQSPYYGQLSWFANFHSEKLPSALERYANEVRRVTGVLEKQLQKEKEKAGGQGDGPWLVGNKYSFVDLAFYSYQFIVATFLGKSGKGVVDLDAAEFPLVSEWIEKMGTREAISKVMPPKGSH